MEFIQFFVYFNIFGDILLYPVYLLVFFATLIIGYLIIIIENTEQTKEHLRENIKEKRKSQGINVTWEDVGNEFKKVFFNIGEAFNRLFEDKNKKRKR
jgi:hypothetical protein